MTNVKNRILTGSAYVTLLLIVIMHPISALALFSIVAIMATIELKKIFKKQNLDLYSYNNYRHNVLFGFNFSEIKFILFLEIIIYFISLLFHTSAPFLLAGGTLSVLFIFSSLYHWWYLIGVLK